VRAVNLLPGAARDRRRLGAGPAAIASGRALPALAALGALALLGALGYAGHSADSRAERLADEISGVQARQVVLSAELEDFRLEARREELQAARRGAITALVSGRTDWERIIRDIATVVPEGVWLTTVSSGAGSPPAELAPGDDPAQPAPPPPPTISIEAIGDGQPAAAATMARVGAVTGLSRPRLVSSAFEDVEGERLVRFVIEATIDQRAQSRDVLAPVVVDPATVRP
jgi:Tfp pilus assembly protein PilN